MRQRRLKKKKQHAIKKITAQMDRIMIQQFDFKKEALILE